MIIVFQMCWLTLKNSLVTMTLHNFLIVNFKQRTLVRPAWEALRKWSTLWIVQFINKLSYNLVDFSWTSGLAQEGYDLNISYANISHRLLVNLFSSNSKLQPFSIELQSDNAVLHCFNSLDNFLHATFCFYILYIRVTFYVIAIASWLYSQHVIYI